MRCACTKVHSSGQGKPLGQRTREGGCGDGGEQVAGQVELDEVGEAPEGGGVDLADVAVGQVQPLQVGQAVAVEDLLRQDLQVVARQIEHLRLRVDLVRDGDLALRSALHVSLACIDGGSKHWMNFSFTLCFVIVACT